MSTRQDTSLHDACAKGDLYKVQEILQKDSDIINRLNQPGGLLRNTPLHEAAREGHVDILQLLLNHGANVNTVDNEGDTPLHYTASQSHVGILQLLLNHGASVNAVNYGRDTPLHKAARWGRDDILQLLLNHGASVNMVNKYGNTPLHHAALWGHVKCIKALLKNGANIKALDWIGRAPYQTAMQHEHTEIAECLRNADKDEAIRRLEALEKGKAKNNRILMMLIGQGRGGKSSLIKRL